MVQWWNSIPGFEKVFWYFAIPFTLVFIIRLIGTLVGFGGADDDTDGADGGDFEDNDGFLADFRLFTLHNFIIFFTGFGWAGIFGAHRNFPRPLTVLFAALVGLFLMVTVAAMFYYVNKLNETGNTSLENALHKTGRVYIPIPAHKAGIGQIQVSIQGSLREVQAVTNGKELPTGTLVTVLAVADNETLLVEKSR